MKAESHLVNDISGLNPVPVWAIARPRSVAEVQEAVSRSRGPLSIGGGRFSMGGQAASPGSLHLDLRGLNQVLEFSPQRRLIRVQAGIRWCDIQRFIDPHGLAVKIMQSYANFTVGGSLSVNVHGRYVGLGPLILSVRSIALVLASGERVEASREHNAELFFGAIGGYGALGVIVEAELELAENTRVERIVATLSVDDYPAYFLERVRQAPGAVFHNADLYGPHYRRLRAVTWVETLKPATVPQRLRRPRRIHARDQYLFWSVSEGPLGAWRREHLIDPLLYLGRPVHWRNYEAGNDAAELEPLSREHRTYVLQEYFVPLARLGEFVPVMAEILRRHRVNAINISVRHSLADPGSLLAWAREECFALVLYHKQRTRENACDRVAVWTRELIEAVLRAGGSYYLPYQPHASAGQFHRAYPRAGELFALKRRLDPEYRLRNSLWDQYYAPTLLPQVRVSLRHSDFHTVFSDIAARDAFYRFLQNIYHLYPEDRFHTLIRQACARHRDDESIYRDLQQRLPGIKPPLADLLYALPALARQKAEMAHQTLQLLGARRALENYVEIGSSGRYVEGLRRVLRLRGRVAVLSETPVGYSPLDLVERGRLRRPQLCLPLGDYEPLPAAALPAGSAGLVSCYIGLHHIQPECLRPFLDSIVRTLRPGGVFVLRDHDVRTPEMDAFVGLAHTVFNAGLGVPWETNRRERRHFAPVAAWVERLAAAGLRDRGQRLLQEHDPSLNVLMAFDKPGPAEDCA